MSMTRFVFLALVFTAATVTADAPKGGGTDCGKSPNAKITQDHTVAKFVGACETIEITGDYSRVSIESAKTVLVHGDYHIVEVVAAGKIDVHGDYNKVTWKKGLTGAKPDVTTKGDFNTVGPAK